MYGGAVPRKSPTWDVLAYTLQTLTGQGDPGLRPFSAGASPFSASLSLFLDTEDLTQVSPALYTFYFEIVSLIS